MHFYELHEGDDEMYSDVILAHEDEVSAEAFFDLVQEVRRRIQGSYAEDTLIEAIAVELERDHDFVYVSDDRITAAVNVSVAEDENYLIANEDELSDTGSTRAEYRGVLVDFDDDGESRSRPN